MSHIRCTDAVATAFGLCVPSMESVQPCRRDVCTWIGRANIDLDVAVRLRPGGCGSVLPALAVAGAGIRMRMLRAAVQSQRGLPTSKNMHGPKPTV